MDDMKGHLLNENIKSNMMKRKGEALRAGKDGAGGGKEKAKPESKTKAQPEPVAAAEMKNSSAPKENSSAPKEKIKEEEPKKAS